MKRIVLIAGIGLGLCAQALAADLPVKAPPLSAFHPYTGSGFYVGFNTGGGGGSASMSNANVVALQGLAGITVGYAWAMANQQSVKAADTVVTAAAGVQRFAELHSFDLIATAQVQILSQQLTKFQSIEAGASGRQKQIATEAVSTVKQAIDAVGQYRKAVAFSYRLADADTAHQDLNTAVASLKQQAQAWQHS